MITLKVCLLSVLVLYKLAAIPLAYLCSLALNKPLNGFLFMLLIQFTIVWVFGIHIRTLFDWTMTLDSYSYKIGLWLVKMYPTNSLLDALTGIVHTNRMNELCSQVPAFTATNTAVNTTEKSATIIDGLLDKVEECLKNNRAGSMFNQTPN